MTRRNIFKLACCAVAASAMEVCGWKMPKPTATDYLVRDAHRLMGEIFTIGRAGPLSTMIQKGNLPEGMGYNLRIT